VTYTLGFLRRSALLLACILGFSATAQAQDVQRIAAVVNEEVISIFDVQQRMQILIASSGLPNTRETQRRIGPQVLRGLIDEALQMQEANRLNIRVTERDLQDAISRVEQSNNIPPGGFEQFLQRQGISVASAEQQIRVNIAWQKLLARTVIPTIEIGDEAIDDVIARIEANRGVTEFRVGEILLPVDNPADAADIRALADRLVQQLRSGADFRAVAQQFSKSATAATGGDIGWVLPGELEGPINSALTGMTVGQISEPLDVSDGIAIITPDRATHQRTPR
jgi:peptidyl-prolyl cis-trans isomerase SurA